VSSTCRDGVALAPGTVVHTFGYPQPGIFGFLYVLAPGTVSLGIFVPSWLEACARTVVPLPPALDAASVPVALAGGRHPALVGREVGDGVGAARASPTSLATATHG
jgi:hypothetical protein